MHRVITCVNMFTVRMSVKAFELVPAIERINLLSEKASTQVCWLSPELNGFCMMLHKF